jgi:hypothetical protein
VRQYPQSCRGFPRIRYHTAISQGYLHATLETPHTDTWRYVPGISRVTFAISFFLRDSGKKSSSSSTGMVINGATIVAVDPVHSLVLLIKHRLRLPSQRLVRVHKYILSLLFVLAGISGPGSYQRHRRFKYFFLQFPIGRHSAVYLGKPPRVATLTGR